MTALVRYYLALTVHAQRYLAPLLLHATVLTVFTVNDTGPLVGSYVVVAGSLLLVACWLTVTIVNLEDPARRAVTLVTAGGAGRVLAAEVVLVLLAGAALIVVGTVFPVLSGRHEVTVAALAVGVAAQATTAGTGVAVGLICSRLVVPRPGWSLVLALVVVVAIPLAPGLPPVNPMLRLMSGARAPAGQLAPIAVDLAVAIVLLAASAAATHRIALRRD